MLVPPFVSDIEDLLHLPGRYNMYQVRSRNSDSGSHSRLRPPPPVVVCNEYDMNEVNPVKISWKWGEDELLLFLKAFNISKDTHLANYLPK